jgi:hypothetical protein
MQIAKQGKELKEQCHEILSPFFIKLFLLVPTDTSRNDFEFGGLFLDYLYPTAFRVYRWEVN